MGKRPRYIICAESLSYNCCPQGTGRLSIVIPSSCKYVLVKSFQACGIFLLLFPINVTLIWSRRYFVFLFSLSPSPATPPTPLSKSCKNSFHFKVLIQGLALSHRQCFDCPLVAVLNHIMFQKENLWFCVFFYRALNKNLCPGSRPLRNRVFSCLKRIMMNFHLYFDSSLLQFENPKPLKCYIN